MQDQQYTSVSVSVSDTNENYEKYVETNEHPMSESLFNNLSSVIGFNDMNGKLDSLKIIVHEKKCSTSNSCTINILDSRLKEELLTSILRKAATLEKELKKKK